MQYKEIADKGRFLSPCGLTKDKINRAFENALKVIDKNLSVFDVKFPSEASQNYMYSQWDNDWGWGQGFWTGILWLAYSVTGEDKYRKTAEMQIPSFEKRIYEKINVDNHDMGFLYIPSCVAAYKLTGNKKAEKAAIAAADNLMLRYHEKGEFIQAWGELDKQDSYRLIIDCLMNIPLLYWASEVSGNMKYAEAAYRHYNTTIKNIARDDGTTFHTFYFDIQTGKPLKGVTRQGAGDNSCWARGQAWGIYGSMLTYMYKKNEESIPFFKKVTNCCLNKLPKDYVAYWDMIFTDGSGEERDSSAAAITVCGLLEGARFLDDSDEDKKIYIGAADHIMESLIDSYTTKDIDSNGLLMHQVYSKPGNCGVDELNIWGDYFYTEALARYIIGNDFHAFW